MEQVLPMLSNLIRLRVVSLTIRVIQVLSDWVFDLIREISHCFLALISLVIHLSLGICMNMITMLLQVLLFDWSRDCM